MSSCCGTDVATAQPCPRCGHVGPIVGSAPVRPHRFGASDGVWQHCANEPCEVVFYFGRDTVETKAVVAQVGFKAADKATPVCFCFAHTAESLREDFAAHDGVSTIKASIKRAVADSQCACEHLNPSGSCCLTDVHRTLRSFGDQQRYS